MATKERFGDENVLKDVAGPSGSRMTGREDHDVAGLVPGATAAPVWVPVSSIAAADATGARFGLLGSAACAVDLCATGRTAKMSARWLEESLTLRAHAFGHARP